MRFTSKEYFKNDSGYFSKAETLSVSYISCLTSFIDVYFGKYAVGNLKQYAPPSTSKVLIIMILMVTCWRGLIFPILILSTSLSEFTSFKRAAEFPDEIASSYFS